MTKMTKAGTLKKVTKVTVMAEEHTVEPQMADPHTVTIDGNDWHSYASLADANTYLRATLLWSDWNAETGSESQMQEVALAVATRNLDALNWEATYNTVAKRDEVEAIEHACAEWAGLIVQDPDANANPGSDVNVLESGSVGDVSADFRAARPTAANQGVSDNAVVAMRLGLPVSVFMLIKNYIVYSSSESLSSTVSATGAVLGHSACPSRTTTLDGNDNYGEPTFG